MRLKGDLELLQIRKKVGSANCKSAVCQFLFSTNFESEFFKLGAKNRCVKEVLPATCVYACATLSAGDESPPPPSFGRGEVRIYCV
jgi:hypothetical protein